MKNIAKLGAVLGLVALGGCVGDYDSYGSTTYYDGGGYGPAPYETYYGPDYYPDRPYYGGGGGGSGYRAYNPGRGYGDGGGYRRGNRDAYRGEGPRGGQRGEGRRDENRNEARQQRPQPQAQQQWQPQPGVSARSQIFGSANTAPAPAASAPQPNPPSGWNGFQGRNPNDPNNTD